MNACWRARIAAGMTAAALATCLTGTAWAASSLSKPGESVGEHQPRPEVAVDDQSSAGQASSPEVEFTITNFRLEAPDLYLDKGELVKILQDGMGEKKTMTQLNVTLNSLTRYCRSHGYPAAAAYVPAQESSDGMITIRVIPGRYGEVKLDNQTKMKASVAQGFINGLKTGDIIRTNNLESALYSLSDISGTRAVGVLSPGREFGTSDLTVRLEKAKGTNTIFYVENYGSQNSGRYRAGVQHNIYDVAGTGGKASIGALASNADMHNYYVNYEALIGRGGTTLGLGFSRMDYKIGGLLKNLDANGVAYTFSLFGKRPIYHYLRSGMNFVYGYDYRKLEDNIDLFDRNNLKHTHSVHAGINGFEHRTGTSVSYSAMVTTGTLGFDSKDAIQQYADSRTEGHYTKAEGNVTLVQRLGNRADVMVKASGQLASKNLDGSEEMYLGGASGVRAYPQGEGSGDVGILGTIETRFYTKVPGLVFSTYFDMGHVQYNKDGRPERLGSTNSPGQYSSGETLKGWGVGLAYTKPNDWFARLDYARRIGSDPNLSEAAKAKGRMWFMLGKIW